MRKEFFESEVFSHWADTGLIMFNADFPRNKKNQLPGEIKKQNESLADQYNPEGKFPFTLLLTSDGKVVKTWDALPNESAEEFTNEVKNYCSGRIFAN